MQDSKVPVCAAARLPQPRKTPFKPPRPRRAGSTRSVNLVGYLRRCAARAQKEADLAVREAKMQADPARREAERLQELVLQLQEEKKTLMMADTGQPAGKGRCDLLSPLSGHIPDLRAGLLPLKRYR